MSPRSSYLVAVLINAAVLAGWVFFSHHLLGSWTSVLTYGAGFAVCGLAQWGINEAFCCPGCGASLGYWYVGGMRIQMPWPASKCGKCGEPLNEP